MRRHFSPGQGPLRNITREDLAPIWSRLDIRTEDMARALGVSRAGLSYHALKKLGLPSRGANRKCMARDIEIFTAMWEDGVSTAEIAAHFGMSGPACVTVRRKRLGLPPRRKGANLALAGVSPCRGGYAPTLPISEFFRRRAEDGVIAMMDAIAARDAEARRERGLVA